MCVCVCVCVYVCVCVCVCVCVQREQQGIINKPQYTYMYIQFGLLYNVVYSVKTKL